MHDDGHQEALTPPVLFGVIALGPTRLREAVRQFLGSV